MSMISAFKCDQCGRLFEGGKPILYIDCDSDREFTIKEYSRYATIDKGVCSYECVDLALADWIKERERSKEEVVTTDDVAKLTLMDGQPN